MNPALWWRFAWRDLRSGLQGFWIFLTCIALGTAAIAIVGSLSAAIQRGMVEQGQPLLSGDIEFSLIHRQATDAELGFMKSRGELSRVATLRAMAITRGQTALIEIKAIDRLYPLYGTLTLADGKLRDVLASDDVVVVDPLLTARLGLKVGESVKIGNAEFRIAGEVAREPDRLADGFVLGPRVIMTDAALERSGLIQPGSLVTWRYRLKLPEGSGIRDVRAVERDARKQFPDAGWRIRTRDRATIGADNFVERLAYFLTLVGLTALIISGAGIGNAISAFISRRIDSIATLKCLGAPSRSVFAIFLTEILAVGAIAIAIGLLAGAITPWLSFQFLGDILPLPIAARIEPWPLLIAGLFGALVTLTFAIWPLARVRRIPASALFRHRIVEATGWPSIGELATMLLAFLAIGALAFFSYDEPLITAWFLGGLVASFVILLLLAWLIVKAAAHAPKPRSAIWRYALGNLHRPGSAATSVILALGLGLTLFVTLALTDRAISTELRSGLAEKAPAFFFIDVPGNDLGTFRAALAAEPGITDIDSAPMLRGRIVKIGDLAAEKINPGGDGAWALRGDRGLTYSDTIPEGSRLADGEWWPVGYEGPPLVSFTEDVARSVGLKIGDSVTVNVLGRDVVARVANFRSVDWRSLNINFVMVFSPNALKGAPHNVLVTAGMKGGDENAVINDMARHFPLVTTVRVKDALQTVNELLGKMLAAIRGANGLTLLTGVLVLAGALAAGLSGRIYDAVVLKTYGATRRQLIGAFIIEYACLGVASAVFGVIAGTLASWFLAEWILEMPWSFSLGVALFTALVAMILTITAGLVVTWRALSANPAPFLRNE